MQIGKYQLLRKLATGGMAEVFLAKAAGPMGFEKTLVVKRILPHLIDDPAFVEMFLAEAKLAAQLNHPHIVQIFDFGEAEGTYYLAMEYIDGPNLRVLAKRARRLGMSLSPALCARIIANACEGLSFAHDFTDPATEQPLGLVHRDISPDNLLLSRQGAVKVVDFGIAKAAGQSHRTQTGLIKGKLAYMSPEQLRNKPLDRRVDVYALGVVLYELLTGHKPFEAATVEGVINAILFEPYLPADSYRADLPPSLLRILDRALAREREQRYPDCRALQTELEEFILSTGKPVGAYQLSQLVIQVTANVETPTPTPLPGSAPHRAATATGTTGARSLPVIDRGLIPFEPKRPTSSAEETAEQGAPTLAEPVAASATAPHRSRRAPKGWIPALVGVALLAAGGGYVLARTVHSSPMPSPAPVLGALPAPKQSFPLPASPRPAPVAEPLPEGPSMEERVEHAAITLPDPKGPRPGERKASNPASRRVAARSDTGKASEPSASRMGTLRLVVRGWADIWVDGQKMGRVPPINELELSAGRHELELVNPGAAKPYRASITITAGKTTEHRVAIQAASAAR